jgi:hypothetical protein
MPPKTPALLLLGLALLATPLIAACGPERGELEAIEGEPLELGELRYNVQITRFLNPAAVEDGEYLSGLPEPPDGRDYLAVFMRIHNDGEEAEPIPAELTIRTSRGQVFDPLETDNPFALDLDSEIPAGGQVPTIDTGAASGPIKGSMLLYLVDEQATENRPLELEIPGPDGETGTVELDL